MNKFICSIEFCTSYFNLSNKRRVLQGVWRALLKWIEKLSIAGLPEHRSAKTRGLMIHPNNYSLWTQQLIQFNSNFWPPKEKLTKQISVHSIKYLYVPDLSVYTLCENRNLSSQVRPGQGGAELLRALLAKKGHVLAWPNVQRSSCHLLWKHGPLLASMCCTKLCQLKKKKMNILFSSTTFYLVTGFHLVVWCEKFSRINIRLTW